MVGAMKLARQDDTFERPMNPFSGPAMESSELHILSDLGAPIRLRRMPLVPAVQGFSRIKAGAA
jgi:hypothetical protein